MRSAVTFGVLCLAVACPPADANWESYILPASFDTADSFAKAIALAKEKNKAVIVYYTQTNCPPCNLLQSRLRKEEVAGPFRAGYVFTAIWGTRISYTERENYRSRYGVRGAPTWLVFNRSGEYVCTSGGGFDTDEGAQTLHEAIQLRLSATALPVGGGPRQCRAN